MESKNDEKTTHPQLPEKVKETWSVIRERAISKPGSLHDKLSFLKDPDNVNVTVDNTGEGLVNHIFRLQKKGSSEESMIVKRTCDRLAHIDMEKHTESAELVDKNNEEFTLPLDRMLCETRSLDKFNEVLPGTAPQVYMTDVDNHFFIMEDLFKYNVLGKALSEPQLSDEDVVGMVTAVAEAIAAVHRSTHRKTLSSDQFELLQTDIGQYSDATIAKIPGIAKMIYSDPKCPIVRKDLNELVAEHARSCMYGNDVLQKNVENLADLLANKKVCLIHNDFHMGAVLIHQNDAKFIDPEFAKLGAPERDIGLHMADMVSFYYLHEENNPEIAKRFALAVKTFCDCYMKRMEDIIGVEDIASFYQYMSGFTADGILFRILFPATVPGLDKLPKQEAKAFERGVSLFENMRNINSLEKFMSVSFH